MAPSSIRLRSLLVACGVLLAARGAAAPAGGQAAVQGQLRLGRGLPVVGATILLRPASNRSQLYVTATDETGSFRIDGLENGTYRLEARREGLEPLVKEAILVRYPYRAIVEATMNKVARSEENTGEASASLSRSSVWRVEGVVQDHRGAPLAEVRLRLVRPDGSEDPVVTVTRFDGTFEIEGVRGGLWNAEVLGGGFLPLRFALPLEESARLHARLVPYPIGYVPTPEDLMPPEEPIPPADLLDEAPGTSPRPSS